MKTPRLLLLVLYAAAACSSAHATTVIPPTFDELVSHAQVIFQGTVRDVRSQWTGEGGQRHIVTYVTFQVEETLKGNPGASYTVRMLGGTVGDQTMEVTDAPKFKAGDRDILFVENNGSQFIPLVGIMHGRFRLQKEAQTGSEIVVTDHGEGVSDLTKLGKEETTAPVNGADDVTAVNPSAQAARALVSTEFKAAITAKLAARRQTE